MAKPVLMTVDDDAEVLRAVERDLRKRYAEKYRVMRADSGSSALQALNGLKKRNEAVGLLLAEGGVPMRIMTPFLSDDDVDVLSDHAQLVRSSHGL